MKSLASIIWEKGSCAKSKAWSLTSSHNACYILIHKLHHLTFPERPMVDPAHAHEYTIISKGLFRSLTISRTLFNLLFAFSHLSHFYVQQQIPCHKSKCIFWGKILTQGHILQAYSIEAKNADNADVNLSCYLCSLFLLQSLEYIKWLKVKMNYTTYGIHVLAPVILKYGGW